MVSNELGNGSVQPFVPIATRHLYGLPQTSVIRCWSDTGVRDKSLAHMRQWSSLLRPPVVALDPSSDPEYVGAASLHI